MKSIATPSRTFVQSAIAAMVLIVASAWPAAAAPGASSFKEAAETYVAATQAGDANRIAALYAPNAVLLIPGLAPIVGPNAIKALFQRNFALGKNRIGFSMVRAETGSDRAGVYWEWTSEITPESGAARTTLGRSFVYFRKEGDRWLINFDTMQIRPKQ